MNTTRILLLDENDVAREALKMILNTIPGVTVVASSDNIANIKAHTARYSPNLILMDVEYASGMRVDAVKMAKLISPGIKVVVLTASEDLNTVLKCLKGGADGYLLKKTPFLRLIEDIKDAIAGGAPITPSIGRQLLNSLADINLDVSSSHKLTLREKEVLDQMVKGFSYKMAAANLFISVDTVRSHIKKIYEKLQVNSKGEAIVKALKEAIV